MADEAQLKVTFRLVPADERSGNPVVFDDIVRLLRQAVATAAKDWPLVAEPVEGFRRPGADEARGLRGLESKIENRVQQASAASQAAVEKRAQIARELDSQQKLTDQSLTAAQQVVSAVQRAMLRAVAVHVSKSPD